MHKKSLFVFLGLLASVFFFAFLPSPVAAQSVIGSASTFTPSVGTPVSITVTAFDFFDPPNTFRVDCTNNGTWEGTSSLTTLNSWTFNNVCVYPTSGEKTIKFEMADDADFAENAFTITVAAASLITVTASVDDPTPDIGQNVTVTATVTGSPAIPIDYELDCQGDGVNEATVFGINSSSHTFTQRCNYATSGDKPITVRVTDDNANMDTGIVHVVVNGGGPLDATITEQSRTGLIIDFSGSATGGTSPYVGWAWTYGDGGTADVQDPPFHPYATAGDKIVTLTVTDSAGVKNTQQITVTMTGVGGVPLAAFSGTPLAGAAPLMVTFTDASTASVGKIITSWHWDFGDGETSDIQNPSHTYAAVGNYNVVLTVRQKEGALGFTADSENKPKYVIVGVGGAVCGAGPACTPPDTCIAGVCTPPGGPGVPAPGVPGGPGATGKFTNPLGAATFTGLINNIINFIFTIAVILAPILLVIAGVIFMTAAGDPGKVKTARSMMLWTIVGFGVILISKGLVSVLKNILGI